MIDARVSYPCIIITVAECLPRASTTMGGFAGCILYAQEVLTARVLALVRVLRAAVRQVVREATRLAVRARPLIHPTRKQLCRSRTRACAQKEAPGSRGSREFGFWRDVLFAPARG